MEGASRTLLKKKITEHTKFRLYKLSWAVLYNWLASLSKEAVSPELLGSARKTVQ